MRGSYLVDIDGVGRAVLLTPDWVTPPGVYKKYYPGGDYFPTEPQPFGIIPTPDRNTILFDTDSANNQNLHIFPDVNGDGLVDAGVVNSRLGSCRRPTRTHLVALISTGTGFVPRTLSVPVGGFASGAREGFECMGRGYQLSQLLDVNGDGLTDLVQVEGGQLRLYVRRGKVGAADQDHGRL